VTKSITLYHYDRTWDVTSRQPEYHGEPVKEFLAAQPNQPRKWLAARLDGEVIWLAPDMDDATMAELVEAARPYTKAMLRADARQDVLDADEAGDF